MGIRFEEIRGFIKIYDGIRYLVLLGSGQYNAIYNRIRYLISKKSGTTAIILQELELICIILYL